MDNKALEVFLRTLREKSNLTRLHASELYDIAQACEKLAVELNNKELLELSKRLWASVRTAESLSIL